MLAQPPKAVACLELRRLARGWEFEPGLPHVGENPSASPHAVQAMESLQREGRCAPHPEGL